MLGRSYGASERQVNRTSPWAALTDPVQPKTVWFKKAYADAIVWNHAAP